MIIQYTNQTIFDVAVVECGTIESAFAMAALNEISITDSIEIGTDLKLTDKVSNQVVEYCKKNNITPATDIADVVENTERILMWINDLYWDNNRIW